MHIVQRYSLLNVYIRLDIGTGCAHVESNVHMFDMHVHTMAVCAHYWPDRRCQTSAAPSDRVFAHDEHIIRPMYTCVIEMCTCMCI